MERSASMADDYDETPKKSPRKSPKNSRNKGFDSKNSNYQGENKIENKNDK